MPSFAQSPLARLVHALVLTGAFSAATGFAATNDLRVWRNPYGKVDFTRDLQLLAQMHDHVAANTVGITAYDKAGYNVMPLMTYSGVPELSYAIGYRLWAPEDYLAPTFLRRLSNIKVFLPNAEEVGHGALHATSPFLTEYIEFIAPGAPRSLNRKQYSTEQELGALISSLGGFPIMAHPWYEPTRYEIYTNFKGMEVYSAFAAVKRREADPYYTTVDRNAVLLTKWDAVLRLRPETIGIAVNDHFGPDAKLPRTFDDIKDSGKIVVYARAATLAAYREALERGAVLAVNDRGTATKNKYPRLSRVTVAGTTLTVALSVTGAKVLWLVDGKAVGDGLSYDFGTAPVGSRFVRAEVYAKDGSVVYTQAFALRPIRDVDGDYDVDAHDQAICQTLAGVASPRQEHLDACRDW